MPRESGNGGSRPEGEHLKEERPVQDVQHPGGDFWPKVFAWGAWAACFYSLISYVRSYGVDIDAYDSWEFIPILSGQNEGVLKWLWERIGEARVAAVKLLIYVLGILTRGDFRAPFHLSALLLGASGAILLAVSSRIRGRYSYADAFFPLALMHLGNHETLLLGLYMGHSLTVFLLSVVLIVVAQGTRDAKWGSIAAAGASLAVLPYCVPIGEILAPFLALWMLYAARVRLLSGEGRGKAAAFAAAGLAGFAAAAAYFIGYDRLPCEPERPGAATVLKVASDFLGVGLGPVAEGLGSLAAVPVIALSAATLAFAFFPASRSRDDKLRIAGMLLLIAAMFTAAAAVGWGRGGWGEDAGIRRRYIAISTPLLCFVFLSWSLLWRKPGRWVQGVLCAVALAAFLPNSRHGYEFGKFRRNLYDKVRRDIASGATDRDLAADYWPYYYYSEAETADGFRMMRAAKIGPFRRRGRSPAGSVQGAAGGSYPAGKSPEPEETVVVARRTERVRSLAVSSRGQAFASGDDAGGLILRGLDAPGDSEGDASAPVSSLAFSPDSKVLYSAAWSGRVSARRVNGRMKARWSRDCGATAVAVSPDGGKVGTGTGKGLLLLLDSADGREMARKCVHDGEVRQVRFSADGRFVATAGWDGKVKIHDADAGATIREFGKTAGIPAASLEFTPDGGAVAWGAWDGSVHVAGLDEGRVFWSGESRGSQAVALLFPAERILAAVYRDGRVSFHDSADGSLLDARDLGVFPLECAAGRVGRAEAVAGFEDGTVRLWRIPGIAPPAGD